MGEVDLNKLNQLVEQKYLAVQKHPTADLLIYNYTDKATYDRFWTEETLMCRGLIVDSSGKIKARPFKKFFNLEEITEQLPDEPYKVYEKFDGSLGILYWLDGMPYIATRGSFTSDQAKKGTEILHKCFLDELNPRYTYLFEIIYPENRIVVDYGNREGLILLAVIDTETGEEKDLYEECCSFPFSGEVKVDITDLKQLKELKSENKEGFVIRFQSGYRVKIKFNEYVRLHRLLTGVTARRIWDLLRSNQSVDELIERVPEEFADWVTKTKDSLMGQYVSVKESCNDISQRAKRLVGRKDQAIYIKEKAQYPAIVFLMLDGKDCWEAIWKVIRPAAEKSFTTEI